jgi:transposase, IS6 family
VRAYAPELNKRSRSQLKPVNKSYRVDETHIKVKGSDKDLYRAVDSTGQTIEFCSLLNPMQPPRNDFSSTRLRHPVIRCHA